MKDIKKQSRIDLLEERIKKLEERLQLLLNQRAKDKEEKKQTVFM